MDDRGIDRELLFCTVADCNDPRNPGFARPVFRYGMCSSHVKQEQRTGKTTQIAEKLSLTERVLEAAIALAESDSDSEAEYARNKRQLLTLAEQLGNKKLARRRGAAIAKGLAKAKARGQRVGRPPKADPTKVITALEAVQGDVALATRLLAAQDLKISERTVRRVRQGRRYGQKVEILAAPTG